MKKIIKDSDLVPVQLNNLVLDSQVTEGSMNPPTSDAVATAIAGGGTTYTAGDGIAIAEGEISAKVDGTTISVNASGELEAIGGGTSYTAGDGIAIAEGEISAKVDGTTISVNASGELEAIDMVQSTDHSVNDVVVVQSLPVSPDSNTLYLIPEA